VSAKKAELNQISGDCPNLTIKFPQHLIAIKLRRENWPMMCISMAVNRIFHA
jgi:hypothetical protein